MNTPLPLSLIELLILIAGGIMVGITIHFFIVSRKALNESSPITKQKIDRELEERKLRYLNDIDWKNKEIEELRRSMIKLKEENDELVLEAEDMREKNRMLSLQAQAVVEVKKEMVDHSAIAKQLKETRADLQAYGDKIGDMISRIEEQDIGGPKQKQLEEENELLQIQVEELTLKLERILHSSSQKKDISAEMSSMLDNAHSEFHSLQEKISKLENQLNSSHKQTMDYGDMQEENLKLTRLLEEEKSHSSALYSENRELREEYNETEDKLREANFQRQQMQKKIAYLEELNMDLQAVAEANNKLQSQLKRIGELESMLQMLSEEKQELMRRREEE